jgi:16S rRNA (guanine527-N7)-methyltransferase
MDFNKLLKEIGITLSDKQLSQYETYFKFLVEYNEYVNLTAITEEEEVYIKHFYDSILLSKVVDLNNVSTMCDVGAGAGFPSIPLKIVYPQLKVTIVETLGKRITFLSELCKKLGLTDVTLVHERAEIYALTHRESFDVVSARAVANLRLLSELCIPLVKQGGIFLAMKGANAAQECEDAQKALKTLGVKKEAEFEVHLSDQAKRVNYVFRKVKATPKQYPRAFAKMKKNPL